MKINCIILSAQHDEPYKGKNDKVYNSCSYFVKERGADPSAELCQQIKVRLNQSDYEAATLNKGLPKVEEASGKPVELVVLNIIGVRQNVVEVQGRLEAAPAKTAR